MNVEDLNAYTDIYRTHCLGSGKSKKTVEHYMGVLRRFIEQFGEEELSIFTVEKFLSGLVMNRSIATANSYCRALRTFFNFLFTRGLVDFNPMEGIKTPRMPRVFPPALQESEVVRLLKASRENTRDYAICLCLFDTGIRAGELTNLKNHDIDLESGHAVVFGKGMKSRSVFLSERTIRAVAAWSLEKDEKGKANGKNDYVFSSQRGKQLTISGLRQVIRRIKARAGLEGTRIYPHLFRHTFATHYAKAGGDAHSLMLLLGHQDVRTAEIYVHLVSKDLEEKHKKHSPVDRLFNQSAT